MIALVKVIGIFITCMGVWELLAPKIMKRMIAYWREGKRIYLGVMLRILFGMIFILSASQARRPQVIATLGALVVTVGILALILSLEKTKAILNWLEKKPDSFLRLAGLLVIAIGALIIYSA